MQINFIHTWMPENQLRKVRRYKEAEVEAEVEVEVEVEILLTLFSTFTLTFTFKNIPQKIFSPPVCPCLLKCDKLHKSYCCCRTDKITCLSPPYTPLKTL